MGVVVALVLFPLEESRVALVTLSLVAEEKKKKVGLLGCLVLAGEKQFVVVLVPSLCGERQVVVVLVLSLLGERQFVVAPVPSLCEVVVAPVLSLLGEREAVVVLVPSLCRARRAGVALVPSRLAGKQVVVALAFLPPEMEEDFPFALDQLTKEVGFSLVLSQLAGRLFSAPPPHPWSLAEISRRHPSPLKTVGVLSRLLQSVTPALCSSWTMTSLSTAVVYLTPIPQQRQ